MSSFICSDSHPVSLVFKSQGSNPLDLLSVFLVFLSLSGKFLGYFVNCAIIYSSTLFQIHCLLFSCTYTL